MKRRTLLQWATAAAAGGAAAQPAPLSRPVPSSGEPIPRVGLGTWITFNVGQDPPARANCVSVMRAFFEAGGRVIDSSPMYGSSQGVVGEGLRALGARQRVFSADKVWTSSDGAAQVEESRALWQVPRFDLLQVHNLLAWEKQLPLLQAMKAEGRVRYVGITTSFEKQYADFEETIRREHPRAKRTWTRKATPRAISSAWPRRCPTRAGPNRCAGRPASAAPSGSAPAPP